MEFGTSHGIKPKTKSAHFNEGNWVQFGQSAKRVKKELCNVLDLVGRK